MLDRKLILLFVSILFLPNLVLADISCTRCEIGDCVCEITVCDSGILDIFSSTSCSMSPDYEFVFSDGYLKWKPTNARSYYVKILCSDGETQSDCIPITVKTTPTTTTIRKTTTTEATQATTTIPEVGGEGPDYLLIALIVVLVLLIVVAVYYFFFSKKKRRKTFEELYKKWRRR